MADSCFNAICFLIVLLLKNTECEGHGKIVFVDLSHTVNSKMPEYPNARRFQLKTVSTINDNSLYKIEDMFSVTHFGTHIDAPSHFNPIGWNVSDIPLQRFVAPAVVVDVRYKTYENPHATVTPEDLILWEEENGRIPPGSVLLILTGWDRYWNDEKKYVSGDGKNTLSFPTLSPEAAEWIVKNRDIYAIGMDILSFDTRPDFIVHRTLLKHSLYLIENLTNLFRLPKTGITLYVMPTKIEFASGAPARVLAAYIE